LKKSDSTEQQLIESVILERLVKQECLRVEQNVKISIGQSHLSHIDPDFISREDRIIGEIYVHVGSMKKAQANKIANDILKMILLEKIEDCKYRKLLVVCDDAVKKQLTGYSYLSECIRQFEVEIIYIPLTDEERRTIKAAQIRQRMVNA